MQKDLAAFVEHARSKGMDHATIRILLLSAGWREKDIAEALAAESLDMPVPVPMDKGGAREAFLHLITFTSLYTTVISVIILFFTYINRLFPDAAFDPSMSYVDAGQQTTIRWSIAAILVTWPLCIWMSRLLLREMREHPERAWSGIRRWLTYLTLFLTACALIGDGITLLFRLLEGELSVRFLLKVAVILLVAGMTFTYYFLSLKTSPQKR